MLEGEVPKSSRQPETRADDSVAPPIAVCVRCGLTSCAGCAAAPRPAFAVAWEDPGQAWWRRLWRTALASSLEPQRFFGQLPRGNVSEALTFALCAELFALGSLALLGAFGLWCIAPGLVHELLASSAACRTLLLTWVAFVLSMLLLHALWGACLDWGAQGSKGHPAPRGSAGKNGVRFGLYACGWDLLTSPIGMLAALLTRGPRLGWAPVGAAARAPGLAQRAYLERCLGADGAAQRRARRCAMIALSGGMLLVVLLFVAALVSLASRFGY
jgi:hypothetical protein